MANATSSDMAMCGNRGQCCGETCRCDGRWRGESCSEFVEPVIVTSPPTAAPTPRPNSTVVDECADNPYKLTPVRLARVARCVAQQRAAQGVCGCAVGDTDGDGVEDCIDPTVELVNSAWAVNMDLYDQSRKSLLVGRLGLPQNSVSGARLASARRALTTTADEPFADGEDTPVLQASAVRSFGDLSSGANVQQITVARFCCCAGAVIFIVLLKKTKQTPLLSL